MTPELDSLRRDKQALIAALRQAGAKDFRGNSFRCFSHDDRKPSASVHVDDSGVWRWKCHGCGAGGDVIDTRAMVSGVGPKEILQELSGSNGNGKSGRIVATYPYTDEVGNLLYEVCRLDPKSFRQRNADGAWSVKGVRRVPFRLPQVKAAIESGDTILIVEGEKDCLSADRLGFTATCNAAGAGKWTSDHADCLKGANLACAIPHADQKGLAHAQQVAASLVGLVETIKVLSPLGDTKGYDLSDAVADGLTREKLIEIIDAAPVWEPGDVTETVEVTQPKGPLGDAVPTPAWVPFPVDLLPEPLRRFCDETSSAIGCDPSFVAVASLAVCAGAIGGARSVRLKEGWIEPCILWGALIGESGTAKSPAIAAALRPLQEIQREAFERFKHAEEQFERDMQSYETQRKQRRDNSLDDLPPKPEPPHAERCLVGDATIESLAPILESNPKGVLLSADELSTWLDFDRYGGGKRDSASGGHWLSPLERLADHRRPSRRGQTNDPRSPASRLPHRRNSAGDAQTDHRRGSPRGRPPGAVAAGPPPPHVATMEQCGGSPIDRGGILQSHPRPLSPSTRTRRDRDTAGTHRLIQCGAGPLLCFRQPTRGRTR